MLGDFSYSNPTKLYFGERSLEGLRKELPAYGKNVLLVYGGGSIRKNGIYDRVVEILKACGKEIVEDGGVMPNPTVEKLYEGCRRAREGKVELILAVGGGSVCDYAKAVSVSAYCEEDPWEKYYLRMEDADNKIIPVGCVLTMVGTGSEMNGGSVITHHGQKRKIGHVFGDNVFPKFSILNPVFTFTLPKYQMTAGFFDIMSHILEQYFSGEDDNTSDYIMEGLLRSLIHSTRIAVERPTDYEARSNIMWIATWALNTLVAKGKSTDWMVHMIGQSVGAYTDAHARHDLVRRFPTILQADPALRPSKIQAVCRQRVGCAARRQNGGGDRPGRAGADGGLYARARAGHERPGAWGH